MKDVDFASSDNTPFFVSDDLNDVILKLKNAAKNPSNGLITTKRKMTQMSVILFVALA